MYYFENEAGPRLVLTVADGGEKTRDSRVCGCGRYVCVCVTVCMNKT